jgi:hypothetical protein
MGGSSVTGEAQSSVDNTSQASVTPPDMAAAGYQQDPAEPDHTPALLSGHSPLDKALFQAKPLLKQSFADKSFCKTKALATKNLGKHNLGKQKDRQRRSSCRP